ncbi:MAG: phage protease [Acidobacteria bacterium]|nr:phage protease [Acidobacteriota bacterium]
MSLPKASHASQLPECCAGEALAEWYQLLPIGTFSGRDGRGPYRITDPATLLTAFSRWSCDLCVDYEHQSLDAAQKAGPIPAAGWIKALEVRADGVWARIAWTETAAACLQAKEYRYLSPVFSYDPKNGEVLALTGAGLTNTPNLHLRAAASRQGDPMNELLERLCVLLDVPVTTSAEDVLGRLKPILAEHSASVSATHHLAKSVGLAEGSNLATVAQAVQSRLAQPPDPAQYVPKAVYDQTAHSLAQLQDQMKAGEVRALVSTAMSAGKVPPALEAWALEYAKRDTAGFRSYLETAPVLASASHATGSSPERGTGASDLTPEQEAVRVACGLDRAAFLKTLNAQE